MRYTDEGETIELCRWTVDLGTLPSFQQHANNPQPGGFYTDFELGLELDSAGEFFLSFLSSCVLLPSIWDNSDDEQSLSLPCLQQRFAGCYFIMGTSVDA